MKILFCALFDLVEPMYEIARSLEKGGIDVYWQVSDKVRYQFLIEKKVNKSKILYLSSEVIESQSIDNELIEKIENKSLRTIKINAMGDRFINHHLTESSFNEIKKIICYQHEFIKNKEIKACFGEPTNRDILSLGMICEFHEIPFIYPQSSRIPGDRHIFQLEVSSSKTLHGANDFNFLESKEFIKKFRENLVSTTYTTFLRDRFNFIQAVKIFGNRIKNLFKEKDSLIHHKFLERFNHYIVKSLRSFYLQYLTKYDDLNNISTLKNIAYFPLHVQPELSTDVLSPFYNNQLDLAKNIAQSLPDNFVLVVKEHPDFLGQKKLNFFRNLRKLPSVVFLKHDASSKKILEKSSIVFTISGTVGIESSLMNIPTITFCDLFLTTSLQLLGVRDLIHCLS